MSSWSLQEALTRGRGRERSFRCPVHGDHTASASVNVAKGVWVCYACGAKGRIDEVIESEGYQFLEEVSDLMGDEQRTYPESWLDQYDSMIHPYWQTRFTDEAIKAWRLGWDFSWMFAGTVREAPCYPMRDIEGTVLGVVHRSLAQDGPKYVYPYGVEKSELLFGLHVGDYQPSVVLVEGAMDVVACWEAGISAYGLYGSSLSVAQLTLLSRAVSRRVVLALDNDQAGQRAINGWRKDSGEWVPGIMHRLHRAGFETVVPDWQGVGAKDIEELSINSRKNLLHPLAL